MNVRNCRKCGKLFNYVVGAPICPACKEGLEADFQRVKEYIREHKGAGIPEVAKECEVESSQITQWLREERLELEEGSALLLYCEKCGDVIFGGRYCEKCKRELTNGFKDVLRSSQPDKPQKPNQDREKEKMRFLK